ncbi:MAG: response regulator [Microcoleaceae cyanobacterium]
MKSSFGKKLVLAISLLSVGVTSGSLFFSYVTTKNLVISQMKGRLADVGRTGVFLLDENQRNHITELSRAIAQNALPITEAMLNLGEGETAEILSQAVANQYMETPAFQELVQVLRKIKFASRQAVEPLQILPRKYEGAKDQPLIKYAYILTNNIPRLSANNILVFVADADYDEPGDKATPFGTIYGVKPEVIKAFAGEVQIADPYTDKWGTFMTAVIPIKDSQGRAIAVLNIDYDVTSEANQLIELRKRSLYITFSSLILSLLVAYLLARKLQKPIEILQQSAMQVHDALHDTTRQYQFDQMQVEVNSQDELGLLANTFNLMLQAIGNYANSLQQKHQELEELNLVKDEFLANTSHELRTPLNGMIGIAESMLDGINGNLSEQQIHSLSLIVQSGYRLSNLINDILDFAKLKQANLELQFEPLRVREVLDVVLSFLQYLLGEKNVSLINNIPADTPFIYADNNRLQQIFYNLVGNAIKFTSQGVVEISATVVQNNHHYANIPPYIAEFIASEQMLEITVRDTGIGIPPEKIAHIFQSFVQADGTTAREYGGTGLGLTITKKLVELHQGQISVNSTVGQGSKFIFTLPIVLDSGLVTSDQIAPTPALVNKTKQFSTIALNTVNNEVSVIPPDLNNSRPRKFTILIVDDEPINLQVLVNHLTLNDYFIAQAGSGMEALEMIDHGFHPDLILLDVMMPKMTGYEVTRKIREKWPADELPILLLSAKNQTSDLVSGLEAGANDYLTKPITKDELLARIKTHLQIKELEAETLRLALEGESHLRQFLEAIPLGVFIIDAQGHPYYANEKAKNLLGRGVVAPDDLSKLPEIYKTFVAGTEEIYPKQRQPLFQALKGLTTKVDDLEIRQGEKSIPIEVWGTPIYDKSNQVAFALAAFVDITERRQAELERQRFTDELSHLNEDLQKALDAELEITDSYGRFVPHQFLYFLGHESIVDVKLGDAVQQEMSVLFADIRSFTTISESMSPEDNFKFINAFLSRMEPAIIDNNGFIDKYIGDAIMALFGGDADDALQAAISMLNHLNEYNTTRGRPGRPMINIGVGINTGDLMLGTVGGQNRMEGTVISDAVNLAARMEELTKYYGVSLLISHYTFLKLNSPIDYNLRLIDRVKVKGKSEMVTVYEVFDADLPDLKEKKLATKTKFEEALLLYYTQHFEQAAHLFSQCLQFNPEDQVALVYWQRCQTELSDS